MIDEKTIQKLEILSDAAKYDTSCSSSFTNSPARSNVASGICHTYTADGRCISLLKVLYSNRCIYDCTYCANRASSNCARASFTPEELVNLTDAFYRRNYISGLFLSSAVEISPNRTMYNIYKTLDMLRNEYRFKGYIHAKAIPGADPALVQACGFLADRMSINVELPSRAGLKTLAPQKDLNQIVGQMGAIASTIDSTPLQYALAARRQPYLPGGQSTQMIVGATQDNDYQIMRVTKYLYNTLKLSRVAFSAYIPVQESSLLPSIHSAPPLKRENRLYQADWLLRYYHFDAEELLSPDTPYFSLEIDPKTNWALNNYHLFPIEVTTADYKTLLRIPGIGRRSAKRIVNLRRNTTLDIDTIKRMGVVLKRAKYFITVNGRRAIGAEYYPEELREYLSSDSGIQMSFLHLLKHDDIREENHALCIR